MWFSTKRLGAKTVRVTIAGELDAMTTPEVEAMFDRLVTWQPWEIEIELSRLRMIDSIGIGALVRFCKRLYAAGCPVKVTGLHDQPSFLIRMLELDERLAHLQPGQRPS